MSKTGLFSRIGLFANIGGKIKGVAKFIFWTLSIFSFFGGIITYSILSDFIGDVAFILFLLILIAGVITAFLTVMLLYGFGALIEDTEEIKMLTENLVDISSKNN